MQKSLAVVGVVWAAWHYPSSRVQPRRRLTPQALRTIRAKAAALPVGSSGGANLIFSAEFSTNTLKSASWQTGAWWSSTTCSIETNNEQELCTKNNDGSLNLQGRHESAVARNGKTYSYTSGKLRRPQRPNRAGLYVSIWSHRSSGEGPQGSLTWGRLLVVAARRSLVAARPGTPNGSTLFPSNYLVDYVRVWDRFGPPTRPPRRIRAER